jgi:hypothetical protein
MALNGQKIRYENLRSLAFGSVLGTYVGVGGSFQHPVRILNIDNTTDQDMYISFDGINDKTILMARSGKIFDYATNKIEPIGQLEQDVGERVYVKTITVLPSDGGVFVTVIYADNH